MAITKPRTTAPAKGNKYYVLKKDGGYSTCCEGNPTKSCHCKELSALPNCVGFALGCWNEIRNQKKFDLTFSGNAEDFWASAKAKGYKIGQVPKLGAIAVWRKGQVKNAKDGFGHVAIVSQLYSTSKIMTSESGYSCNKLMWTTIREKGSDGNWGMAGYNFLGFIYHPDMEETVTQSIKITVDGIWGPDTTTKLQVYLGTTIDGVISGQLKSNKKLIVAGSEKSWKFTGTKAGSRCIMALQKLVGATQDGQCGPKTINKLQAYLTKEGYYKKDATGVLDKETVKALQNFLNKQVK